MLRIRDFFKQNSLSIFVEHNSTSCCNVSRCFYFKPYLGDGVFWLSTAASCTMTQRRRARAASARASAAASASRCFCCFFPCAAPEPVGAARSSAARGGGGGLASMAATSASASGWAICAHSAPAKPDKPTCSCCMLRCCCCCKGVARAAQSACRVAFRSGAGCESVAANITRSKFTVIANQHGKQK